MSNLIKKLRMTIGQCDCPCQDAVIAKAAKELERLEGALREIAASELSSGGQLRMLAREALTKEQT